MGTPTLCKTFHLEGCLHLVYCVTASICIYVSILTNTYLIAAVLHCSENSPNARLDAGFLVGFVLHWEGALGKTMPAQFWDDLEEHAVLLFVSIFSSENICFQVSFNYSTAVVVGTVVSLRIPPVNIFFLLFLVLPEISFLPGGAIKIMGTLPRPIPRGFGLL